MRMPPDYCLLGRKKSGVVTDGLIFWMDGRDAITGTTAYNEGWSSGYTFDRINGVKIDFSLIKEKSYCANEDEKIKLYSPYNIGAGTKFVSESVVENIKSIEFVGVVQSTLYIADEKLNHDTRAFFPVRSSDTGAKLDTGVPIFGEDVHIVCTGNQQDGKPVIYLNHEIKSVTGTSATAVAPFDATTIASVYLSTSKESAYIGAIRFYDRYLTPEEIQKNYNYEKSLGRVT